MAKRNELSLPEKFEMLDKFNKHPHSSQRELGELFKIPRSTLNRLRNKNSGETSHTQRFFTK